MMIFYRSERAGRRRLDVRKAVVQRSFEVVAVLQRSDMFRFSDLSGTTVHGGSNTGGGVFELKP
jgi:hypothetical protein